jgi:hypothetical protein
MDSASFNSDIKFDGFSVNLDLNAIINRGKCEGFIASRHFLG